MLVNFALKAAKFIKAAWVLCFLCSSFTVHAKIPNDRVALIIGNANYKYATPLHTPINDANDMASTLKNLGYKVFLHTNLDKSGLREAFWEFEDYLNPPIDTALIYYAGHGMARGGTNFLIPVDANISEPMHITRNGINLNEAMEGLSATGVKVNVVILDASRTDPFKGEYRAGIRNIGTRGLSKIEPDDISNIFIAYSTAPGTATLDSDGRNGLYTKHLLKALKVPSITIEKTFRMIRLAVRNESVKSNGYEQIPWALSSLETIDDVYLGAKPKLIRPENPAYKLQDEIRTLTL